MSEEPEVPVYVAYPRGQKPGTADQLQALADGYFGLWRACLLSFLIAVSEGILINLVDWNISLVLCFYVLSVIVITWLTLPSCKKMTVGMDRPHGESLSTALVLGITAPFCVGLLLFAQTLQKTLTEILKYGVRNRFLSTIRKSDVEEVVFKMKAEENGWKQISTVGPSLTSKTNE